MYTQVVPFKDFNDKPRNMRVQLNLTEREVFKLLVPLQAVFAWRDSLEGDEERVLSTEEVVDFYNNLEKILLEAWGELSEDGLHFRKAGRYDFEESALFNATMMLFVTDPQAATKMLDGLMPKGMEEMVKTMDTNLSNVSKDEEIPAAARAEIARLQAKLAAQNDSASSAQTAE